MILRCNGKAATASCHMQLCMCSSPLHYREAHTADSSQAGHTDDVTLSNLKLMQAKAMRQQKGIVETLLTAKTLLWNNADLQALLFYP